MSLFASLSHHIILLHHRHHHHNHLYRHFAYLCFYCYVYYDYHFLFGNCCCNVCKFLFLHPFFWDFFLFRTIKIITAINDSERDGRHAAGRRTSEPPKTEYTSYIPFVPLLWLLSYNDW